MENKKWFVPTLILIGVLLLTFVGYRLMKRGEVNPLNEYPPIGNDQPCPGETRTLVMEDPYMQGVLERGQKFRAIFNYYACNPLKRGDLVLHRLSTMLTPTVKIVRGIPGDHFSLSKDKEYNAWNVTINGEMVMSSDGRKYFFGAPSAPPMALYEKSSKGVLLGTDIIILSAWAPGDRDSGIFGVMSIKDVVAKVELIDGESKPAAETPKGESEELKAPAVDKKAETKKAVPPSGAKPAAKPAVKPPAKPVKAVPKAAPKN